MTSRPDELLPKASDFMMKRALAEAEEAAKQARGSWRKSGTGEGRLARSLHGNHPACPTRRGFVSAIKIIERAVNNGLTEVQVCRFPNQLCTDRGRAINQQEPGWGDDADRLPEGNPSTVGEVFPMTAATSCGSRSSTFLAACRATSA